jgi:hypothetical protein
MTTTEQVAMVLMDAEGIAFDGCHKIFILMDEAQTKLMVEYGYGKEEGSHLLVVGEGMLRSEMLHILKEWWNKACLLKFIQATTTTAEGTSYKNVIEQGRYWL